MNIEKNRAAEKWGDRPIIVKARTAAFFAAAVAVLYILVLGLWLFRPAKTSAPQAPRPPAEVNTIAAPFTEAPQADSAPQTITVAEALERLQEAARVGQTSAMLDLAEFYGRGLGVRQNFTERFHWLQKAAEAGDPRGIYLAAVCQETGLGTTADPEKARAGFLKAAEIGLAEAHLKLAEGFMAGPEADQVRAANHLEEALAGGLPLAANILGRLYLEGAGNLAADAGKARRALQRGAELLDPEAMKNLAVMFRQGWGGPADPAEALKWYLAAREAGWQDDGMDEALAKLEGELEPRAVSEAKAGARAWLEEHRASGEASPPSGTD